MSNKYCFLIIFFLISSISQSTYAQDWANINRFKNANMELSSTNRIVFMGNSITEGWSNLSPDFFVGKPYINRGIGGQTTPQMLVRFRSDVINLKPSVVVILAGINDIAQNTGPISIPEIADNIKSMADLAEMNNIQVILCSVLPAASFPWSPDINPTNKVVELNALIKEFAEAKGHIYLDYFSKMANTKNGLIEKLGYDPVHPNKEGYLVMEPLLEGAIQEALNRIKK